jgi:hypothetical protein
MRTPLAVLAICALVPLAGCAAGNEQAPPRTGTAQPTPLTDTWVTADREMPAPASVRTLKQGGTILIGDPAPPPAPTRPNSRGKVVVSFHRADLENAMRFLADSGRFNLIVETGLTGSVTASLRDVDAYDALVPIAQANGAEVRYERGIVTVRRAAPASAH